METNKKVPAIRFKGFEEEWEEKKFGENILSIQTGTNLLGSTYNSGTPLIKMGNIQRGFFSFDKVESLAKDIEVEKQNIAYYGDFLFNTRNTLELVGKGATWMGMSGKYAFNNNIARFVFEGINTIFFNYLYNTENLISQVRARAMGTTSVAAIYPQNLNSITYWLPKFDEQTQIGNFCKELDNLIRLQEQKLEKTVNLKKAMLEKMFPKENADVPELRFKGFTEKWEKKKLGEVAEFNPKAELPYQFEYVDLESVSGTRMIYHRTETINNAPSRAQRLAKKGDLFYQAVRPYQMNNYLFELPDEDYVFSTGYAQLRPKIDSRLLLNIVQNKLFIKNVLDRCTGTSYPAISSNDLALIEVSIPQNEKEQQKIGAYFQNLDQLITKSQEKIKKLKNLKQALLQKMFI